MLRPIVVCLAFSALLSAASAQAPAGEDSAGPYRLGMSAEAARSTAPEAAWSSDRRRNREVLTGGPDVAIAGQMTPALVFVDDALVRLVLVGVAPNACTSALQSMVEALETRYGAFISVAPNVLEEGRLTAATRTPAGSEIRVRDVEGHVTVSSARYGDTYVVAQGRPEEGDDERCRLTLTLGVQSDWVRTDAGPGPTWAELDRAESLADPVWTRRPTAQSFVRHYPEDAVSRGIDGVAVLDCLVVGGGVLNCRVAHESPLRAGFGLAALRVAADFRVEQGAGGTTAIGRRVRVPIRFIS